MTLPETRPCPDCGGTGEDDSWSTQMRRGEVEVKPDFCRSCNGVGEHGECSECGRWVPVGHTIEAHGTCSDCVECAGVCYP